jgi:hypothetical protein
MSSIADNERIPARTGPKTEAGKQAVAANLPHPVKHGLRTRVWAQQATVPCHPGSCPFVWEECTRRPETEQGCPVLPEVERARFEALVADLDPAERDPDTGEATQPAGSNLSLAELDALAEYERLGTIMLVCERWFARAGMLRASGSEGLAFQGAMKQYFYAMISRDRMRERHGWTKPRGEQHDLAAAILAVTVRAHGAPRAPMDVVEAEVRALPPSDEEQAHTPPHRRESEGGGEEAGP